ncbi:MAG: glycosyltransferase [Acidobacteriaceae bacterium]|jgi:glycosyltransferase involved in cell wall biosynthesis|nr:glycosyltransferase [Acidobacteriaceae bacterium]
MRIAIATDWWLPRIGGVESQVSDLASVLIARGHDVRVLTTTRNPVPAAGMSAEHVTYVDVPILGDVSIPDFRRIPEFAERLRALSPDVVHAHGMFSTFAIGAVLASARVHLPSMLTVHSLLRPAPVFMAASAVFRLFANRATLVTGVSAATVADVERASGREALWIPNGVRLSDWQPAPEDREAVRVLTVTRLAPKKRTIDVVRAVAAALCRTPDGRVRLEIIGDGPERSRLEQEVMRLGLAGRVIFHGACSRARVRELLSGAALLAHPGTREAFGLAILEARASGVPVVAIASGGVPELVTHETHGLLARNHEEFGAALARMIQDVSLRQRCRLQAPIGLDAYDWPEVAARFEAAYARAMSRTSARRKPGAA